MTDTQRRIEAYKAALPGLKERVVAVALLLAMSFAMMTSASFAWLTISRRPEVTGVQTNVAANGNLEIALATGDGKTSPGESQVGDSSAAEEQSVPDANVTWGNLINLADPSYGLDNLTMRPAQLNKSDLLGSPLYGAVYNADGRIEKLNSNFSYTQWVPPAGLTPGYFGLSTGLGVRAISSTKVEAVGVWETITDMKEDAEGYNGIAANNYIALTQNDSYMQSLAYLMGTFMTDKMNATQGDSNLTNPTVDKTHLGNLVKMYEAFVGVFEDEAKGMVALLNLQQYMKYGGSEGYTPYTVQSLLATTEAELTSKGLKLEGLNRFKQDYALLTSDLVVLTKINNSGTVKWRGTQVKDDGTVVTVGETDEEIVGRSLKAVLNSLVNLNTCTLNGINIGSIGAGAALELNNKTKQAAIITNGVLYEFERRTGAEMNVGPQYEGGKGLKLVAKGKRYGMSMDGTIYAYISTSAELPSLFNKNLDYALNMSGAEFEGTVTAEDTYGMAIDLWVRTNAMGSYLTLEGNVITRSDEVRAKGKDANGNEVELYTLSRMEDVTTEETDPETGETTTKTESVTYNYDLYQADSDGTTKWYNVVGHGEFTLNQGETPLAKMETVITVLGYEGENRVWDKDSHDFMSADATTQGSGSCYVYYADTPEDQARSLKLLESFKVAFVDGSGSQLATAVMDTQRFYAESGRVTVPLKLSETDSIDLGEDYQGVTQYAITPLIQNVPTRITAIVYLDGTTLSNDQVLAAADIQGQLNIQFGSSKSLEPIENETLASKELRVSASVDKTSFDYDTHVGPMTSVVTVRVDGDAPSTVKAFFLRQISATQGSRETEMVFEKNASGEWVAAHTFTAPGKYVLRSVELDGITHDLQVMPEVTVEGFAIESLSCTEAVQNRITILTAENSGTINLSLRFATDDPTKMPTVVQGRFLHDKEGSAVNVNFSYNPTTSLWTGAATFLTSGDYTMEYLVLDGEYVNLPEAMCLTADVTLGMRVAIQTNSPTSFKFLPSQMTDDQKNLRMQVRIMDNAGDEMPGLAGAKLKYSSRGQSRTMDTDLTWNGSTGYYEGELATFGAGIWEFAQVTVSGNTLTTATTAPTFTLIPPEPPAYMGFMPEDYQYEPEGNGTMNVLLSNANTATVEAVLKNNTSGESYLVLGTLGETTVNEAGVSVSQFIFALPAYNVLGSKDPVQDGHWVMEEVHVRGYFDALGNFVTDEKDEDGNYVAEPLLIDMTGKNYTTKVVQTVNLTIREDKSETFGKDSTGKVTAAFMTTHADAVAGLEVQLVDFEGAAIEIKAGTDITMKFSYGGDSATYGYYTSAQLTNTVADFSVTLKADSSGTRFIQDGTQDLTYAGTYSCEELSFKVGNRTYVYKGSKDDPASGSKALPANVPTFTVWSMKPYVQFTATNPAAGTNFNGINASEDGNVTRKNVISADKYSVTCYYQGEITDNGCSQACSGYTASKATTTVYDLGSNYTEATCTIVSKGEGSDIVYTYTPSKPSNEQSVGSTSGSGSNAKRLGIGTNAEATQLIVKGTDGNTYTFTLTNALRATATE